MKGLAGVSLFGIHLRRHTSKLFMYFFENGPEKPRQAGQATAAVSCMSCFLAGIREIKALKKAFAFILASG